MADAVRARWSKWVAAAIAFLLASGLYNIAVTVMRFEVPPIYHMLFGIKFLLALGVFFIASLLAGRSAAAIRARQNAKMWLNLNLTLAVLVVLISGYLRSLPHTPKDAAEAPRAAVESAEAAP
jgi:putative copper export protein